MQIFIRTKTLSKDINRNTEEKGSETGKIKHGRANETETHKLKLKNQKTYTVCYSVSPYTVNSRLDKFWEQYFVL